MSLAIACKGPEGIVLAVDSRVTLMAEVQQPGGPKVLLSSTFDNATKLIRVAGQTHVGAVTYGLGTLGGEPRTAHSFVPEFETELANANVTGRMKVKDFATKLGEFFLKQWKAMMPANHQGPDIVFLVGGYDAGEPYGRIFEVHVPNAHVPIERSPGKEFGMVWGGQKEFTDRLLQGFDDSLTGIVQKQLTLSDVQTSALRDVLRQNLLAKIPYQFLPLQDSVDLAIFLVRATSTMHQWLVGVRGVGGAIDVATITRIEGFKSIQQKAVVGERRFGHG